ncbi:MAG: thioredoxin domain-containing protein [Proteobacteria bacterium]|nr:thioredoxin domain-containing protein [Pseudomonadota bacterium]
MKKVVLLSLAALLVISCSKKQNDTKEIIAVVNGDKVTLGDLEAKYPELEKQLFRLEENAFRYKEMYLSDMLENRLIELEAKKLNIQASDLINKEIKSKITPVTDQEVEAFGKDKNIPKDQMAKLKDRVKQYLMSQRENDVKKVFADGLKQKYNVKIKIKKPKQMSKVKIEISPTDPSKGSKSAKVTVVEFSDFQCPFCKRASENGRMIYKEYGDKVRYVFKNFPLSFHDKAHRAAEAAMCMNDQGKFFEYHDKLFENNTALEEADLNKYATEVGGDAKKFADCLTSGKFKADIDKEIANAQKYGISGAPTYFINGVMVVGAVPYAEVKQAIEEAMNE